LPTSAAGATSDCSNVTRLPEFLILTTADCRRVLARNHLGRLAFFNGKSVDIEPIGFALKGEWLYARSAYGTKIESLSRRPFVALEVDEVLGPFDWRSVVVHGTIYELPLDGSDAERRERSRAVNAIKAAMPGAFTGHDPTPERQIVYGLHIDKLDGRMARRASRAGAPGRKRVQLRKTPARRPMRETF
jgi:nitroimidazol reductase NimA-like FMN-containing flavoprotein (pyridoxamine 5'-phosphate oxidase superfamily)